MMPSAPAGPDPMRIADEQRAHPLLLAEGDHRPCALVTQIPDLAALASAGFASGSLQSSIAPRAFLAPVAFLGDLAQSLVVPPLEGADASAGNDQRHASAGGHRRLVDFPQVHCGLRLAGAGLRRSRRNGYVQLIPVVPHQLARPTLLRYLNRQDERGLPSSHRQHNPPPFPAHRLRRPQQWVVAFLFVGIPNPQVLLA